MVTLIMTQQIPGSTLKARDAAAVDAAAALDAYNNALAACEAYYGAGDAYYAARAAVDAPRDAYYAASDAYYAADRAYDDGVKGGLA